MGYTTVSTSMFSPDMRQTPENVAKVLDVAGWCAAEAAREIGFDQSRFLEAISGYKNMPDEVWKRFLDKAGRRSFDHDPDSN